MLPMLAAIYVATYLDAQLPSVNQAVALIKQYRTATAMEREMRVRRSFRRLDARTTS